MKPEQSLIRILKNRGRCKNYPNYVSCFVCYFNKGYRDLNHKNIECRSYEENYKFAIKKIIELYGEEKLFDILL